jgi:DNA-binding CsgD family transcriptional regulator
VRTSAGTWAVLDGSRLEGAGHGKVAVTIRAALPGEVLDLLCRAHELSRRETELVRLLVDGLRTAQIAERLFISPYTVQDHTKAVFRKIGVHSRGELASRISG